MPKWYLPGWMEFRSHWWIHTSIWGERLPAHPSSPSPSLLALLHFPNDWPESYLLVPMLYLHLTQDVGGLGQSRPSYVFSLLYPQKSLWDPVFMFYIQSLSKHLPNTQIAPRERKESNPSPHPHFSSLWRLSAPSATWRTLALWTRAVETGLSQVAVVPLSSCTTLNKLRDCGCLRENGPMGS